MALKDDLVDETEKWIEKMERKVEGVDPQGEKAEEFMKNIDAYISDSSHFLKNEKYIEAFEAVIWAWAYLEIGRDLDLF